MFKPKEGSVKNRKRVGRGNASGWGGESGRGHKGQKSRSGYSIRAGFEGGRMPLYKQLPKKRGFKPLNKVIYSVVNLDMINELYEENGVVNYQSLCAFGVVAKNTPVKILGQGELTKSLVFDVDKMSKVVLEKIKSSKSTIKEIEIV